MKEIATSKGIVAYGQIPLLSTKIEVVNENLHYNLNGERIIYQIEIREGWRLLCIIFQDGTIKWVRDQRNDEISSKATGLACNIKEGNKLVCLIKTKNELIKQPNSSDRI